MHQPIWPIILCNFIQHPDNLSKIINQLALGFTRLKLKKMLEGLISVWREVRAVMEKGSVASPYKNINLKNSIYEKIKKMFLL